MDEIEFHLLCWLEKVKHKILGSDCYDDEYKKEVWNWHVDTTSLILDSEKIEELKNAKEFMR